MYKKTISYFLACFIILQFFSCSNRPDEVMNQRAMKELLTDLHVLEAVLDENPTTNEQERIYYYDALLQKHGITKAIFDSSLVYYTKNPKVFERVYTRVINNLEKFETDVHEGKYFPVIPDSIKLRPFTIEIWKDKTIMHLSKDTARRHLAFSIKDAELMSKDIYWLDFLLRVSPQDSSRNAYAALRIHYADGQVDSLMHKVYNDSVLRHYSFRMKAARNRSIDSLSGTFYRSNLMTGPYDIRIDSISLKRTYVPFLQDSIRLHLDTVKVVVQKIDSMSVLKDIKIFNILREATIKKEKKDNKDVQAWFL